MIENTRTLKISYILVLVMGLAGCLSESGEESQKARYRNVSVDTFTGMMESKDFVLINTHIPMKVRSPAPTC